MDSFSGAASGGSPQMSTEDFMDQLKTQLAQAYAEEFLETVRESVLISVSPNQEVALVAARVVAYLGAWIAILRPPVLSAELFLAPRAEIQWRSHKYGSCGIIT